MPKWAVLRLGSLADVSSRELVAFGTSLKKAGRRNESPNPKAGFTVKNPSPASLLETFKDVSARGVKLLWVVLSSDDAANHHGMKSMAERDFGESFGKTKSRDTL